MRQTLYICAKCGFEKLGINDDCARCKALKDMTPEQRHDAINHPKHYTSHPSGIECIRVTEHMSFTLGNAVKYIWRADLKGGVDDLKKAAWYIGREIERRETK